MNAMMFWVGVAWAVLVLVPVVWGLLNRVNTPPRSKALTPGDVLFGLLLLLSLVGAGMAIGAGGAG